MTRTSLSPSDASPQDTSAEAVDALEPTPVYVVLTREDVDDLAEAA